MKIARGVTRTVLLTRRFAIKVPNVRNRYVLRGWLANRSEWKQRRRWDVNTPRFTLGYLVQWYRRADAIGWWEPDDLLGLDYSNEEAKGDSWGSFAGRWLLIDYDRAWQHPRGWIGALYYGKQERLARKWMCEARELDPVTCGEP